MAVRTSAQLRSIVSQNQPSGAPCSPSSWLTSGLCWIIISQVVVGHPLYIGPPVVHSCLDLCPASVYGAPEPTQWYSIVPSISAHLWCMLDHYQPSGGRPFVIHRPTRGTWLSGPRPSFSLLCPRISLVVLHVPLHLGSPLVHAG
jgi:hypothetical protein